MLMWQDIDTDAILVKFEKSGPTVTATFIDNPGNSQINAFGIGLAFSDIGQGGTSFFMLGTAVFGGPNMETVFMALDTLTMIYAYVFQVIPPQNQLGE